MDKSRKLLNCLGLIDIYFELFRTHNLSIRGMNMTERSVFQIKLLVCVVVLTGAIAFMVHLLWPALGLGTMALYVLMGWGILAGLMLMLVVNTAISSWINQWILRKGGTDTQWLWFPADPPGLQGDRKPKQP
jgi:hypothetical protein